jgi:hypothetical protein
VLLKTKQVLLMLCVLVGMCQKLVLILQLNKTSQDGLYQKLEDPIMTQRNLIEIRLMTQGHQLVNNAIQKIHQLEQLILALLAEKLRRD